MDTSSSQKRKELTTGTLDSEKVNGDLIYFLLHGVASEMKQISNKTWLNVLNQFLYPFKPRLSYIDGLKTLEQMVVDGEWFNTPDKPKLRNTDMRFFPEGTAINKKTRGLFILTIYRTNPDPTQSGRFTMLILTERGRWLEWDLKRSGLNCSSHFRQLSDAELCTVLDTTKQSGINILDNLHRIMIHSRIEKEKRLTSIKEMEITALRILSRARSFPC